jgi:hypothetical protein
VLTEGGELALVRAPARKQAHVRAHVRSRTHHGVPHVVTGESLAKTRWPRWSPSCFHTSHGPVFILSRRHLSAGLRSTRWRLATGIVVVLATVAAAEGGQPPIGERRQPLQELILTEVVYPQEKGELQLTLLSTADKGRNGSVLVVPLEIEFGLTDAWQVGLEWGTYSRVRSGDVVSSGRGGLAIGTKYSFMNINGSDIHAAVGLEMEFPGGLDADGLREDQREVEPFVAVAADLQKGVQAFFHVGRSFTGGTSGDEAGDESAVNVQWSAGALWALRRATLAGELTTRTSGSPWARRGELYATPSITFLLPSPWEVGLGVPIGLNGRSDRFGLAIHVIYER